MAYNPNFNLDPLLRRAQAPLGVFAMFHELSQKSHWSEKPMITEGLWVCAYISYPNRENLKTRSMGVLIIRSLVLRTRSRFRQAELKGLCFTCDFGFEVGLWYECIGTAKGDCHPLKRRLDKESLWLLETATGSSYLDYGVTGYGYSFIQTL